MRLLLVLLVSVVSGIACSPAGDDCSVPSKECDGNGWRECIALGNGSTAWSATTACPNGLSCTDGECRGSCTDECSDGETRCNAAGVQSCVTGEGNCKVWSAASPCPTNKTCQEGACVSECSDLCPNTSSVRCDNLTPQRCVRAASGCLEWDDRATCTGGQICEGGACTGCSSHADCGATQVCSTFDPSTARCVAAAGRTYIFSLVSMSVPESHPTEGSWDVPGGLPDLRATWYVNNVAIGSTPTYDNRTTATPAAGSATVRFTLPAGARFDVIIYDEDLTDFEFVAGIGWEDGLSLVQAYGYDGQLYGPDERLGPARIRFTLAPAE